jgi:hypothetical protein|tara:strand:- start:3579 stop:3776 length:198 start_codon:yes stop_codon:yes gene_type:complete
MAMSKEERLSRKLGHTKQERLQVGKGSPSVGELREGVPVLRSDKKGLFEYVKHNGILYKKSLDKA